MIESLTHGLLVTAGGLLGLSLLVTLIRLARGPSLPDRVIALDLLTVLALAHAGLFTLITGRAAFLDVAMVLALTAFLTTLALARYAERRNAPEKDSR